MKLIGQLSHLSGDAAMPLAVLEEYCNDADPRVRTAAFQALVSIPVFFLVNLIVFEMSCLLSIGQFEMHKRGSKLPLSIYYKVCIFQYFLFL